VAETNLLMQAIQRAMMGFPPGSSGREPEPMQLFELVMERAILGMPSAPLQGPPRYDFLLYRKNGALGSLEE
jgi:hypothetical protein